MTSDQQSGLRREDSEPRAATPSGAPPVVAGLLLALALNGCLLAPMFRLPNGRFYENHDETTYLSRIVEFRAALDEGIISPQWCPHFRGGLGSPYFSFYQPGYFYAASIVPRSIPIEQTAALTCFGFGMLGAFSVFAFVGRHRGSLAAAAAATAFMTAEYLRTDLYIRGDFSEFSALCLAAFWLWRFDETSRRPWSWSGGVLSLATGLLVVTHPCIALLTALLAGLLLLWHGRQRAALFGLTCWLGLGVGLSAFYWYTVFAELPLVQVNLALADTYDFRRHFVPVLDLVNWRTTPTPVPVKVSLAAALAAAIAAVRCLLARGRSPEFRPAVLGLIAVVFCLVLIDPVSQPVWERLSLLQKVQFPWRILSLLSLGTACLIGSLSAGMRPFAARLTDGTVLLLLGCSLISSPRLQIHPHGVPPDAESLVNLFVAPDICNEWLPRTAAHGSLPKSGTLPKGTTGVKASGFTRGMRQLSFQAEAPSGGRVILPHYYYPRGWRVTSDTPGFELVHNSVGLMVVQIPPGFAGEVLLTFDMTPARRQGWWITAGSTVMWLLLMGIVGYRRRWRAPAATEPAA